MSIENNIILVTNDSSVSDILKPKLVLLREVDDIRVTNYAAAFDEIKEVLPEAILVYCSNEQEKCLALIKTIKTDEKLKNLSIMLVTDKYDQDFLLNAYEENITDFMTINADNAEVLMRMIWCLKKNAQLTALFKQRSLLEDLDIISSITGFYTEKNCDKIFENEFKNLKEYKTDGVLMLVSPSEESKTRLNPLHLARSIKSSIRYSDIVVHGSSNTFYVLLEDTQLKGAFCVWEKIKRAAGEQYTLNAGISIIDDKPFDKLKTELLNALVEAKSTNQDLVIVREEEESSSADWLDRIGSAQKNFKLFKQAFNKKLDKVITPIFFQMQKLYEEKLFETEIEQYSNSTLSAFILKKANKSSELKITYPGFSKINIDIIHQGLDSPENKRINLDLTELSESKLTQILEDFIQEFKGEE